MNEGRQEGERTKMRTNASFMGWVEAAVVGNVNGRGVDLRDDAVTPAVEAVVKPDALIDGEVAKSGEIWLVWGNDAPEESLCLALGC